MAPASDEVLASTYDHPDVCILPVQGSTEIESCDAFKPTTGAGADRYDVRRMGLAECRVAVFHISSYAWRNAYEETCRRWAGFLTQCLVHQVDFVQGDGNLFAQRNFKRDVHSDYRTCILVDILSRVLTEINMNRTPTNRITYNICSSTSAAEYIKAQQQNNAANTDNMITIALCYGKQVAVLQERMNHESASDDIYMGPAFDDEINLNDIEQPKHLMVYNLGLSDGDSGWHSPLLVMATLRCQKNRRPRTQEADKRRRQKYDDQKQERSEGRDDIGPLPGERRHHERARSSGIRRDVRDPDYRERTRDRSESRQHGRDRRQIHEYRELHLMNLRIVDNTDLDHLLSRQEIPDAERMIITNEILETDNTVKDHKRIVGIDPDKPDTMNQQMPTGNKRTEISYNGGTSKL